MIRVEGSPKAGGFIVLLGVFGLALAIRLILIWFGVGVPLDAGDAPSYLAIARSLAEGHGYTLDGITPTALRTPLYPIFLAMVFSLPGAEITTAQAVQAVLGSFSCVLVLLLGRILLGERIGLVAGILAAVYFPGACADVSILSESLFGLLLTAAVLLLSLPSRTRSQAVLAGLAMGLSALARPNGIPVALCMAAWLMIRPDRRRQAAVFALAAGLVVLPWVVRNAIVFHRFIPTYSLSGLALYNSYVIPAAGLSFNSLDGAPEAYWNLPDEASRDSFLTVRAFQYIREHPASPFRLLPTKLVLLVYPYDLQWLDMRIPYRYNLFWGFLSTLACLGIAAGPRETRRRLELILPPLVALLVLSAIFYGSPRMRLPFDLLLMLPAAAGLVWLSQSNRRRYQAGWVALHGALFLAGQSGGAMAWLRNMLPW